MCHGFTGDKYEWGRFPRLANECNKEEFDAIFFDFSGSGENERVPITVFKQIQDLESVFKWVQDRGYKKIAVLGLSFGGLTALGAELTGIKAYIFWAPFFFLHTTEDHSDWFRDLNKGPVRIPTSGEGEPIIIDMSFMTDFAKVRVKSNLKKLDIPTLMVQGTSDQSVPYEFTRKAFSLLPKNKNNKLVEINDATHDFEGKHLNEFINHTILWLKDYL
ncbi:MAG: alpha/beta fold hydrolase [Candidatus Lokiarchaeota archaeon]|nr:alpha/beta fold hydrolase [Candidatus Lokiarchaeota archaeon]